VDKESSRWGSSTIITKQKKEVTDFSQDCRGTVEQVRGKCKRASVAIIWHTDAFEFLVVSKASDFC